MSQVKQIKLILKENKEFLREKYFVEKIGVFGSYIRGEETHDSDRDIIVEINGPIGWDFVELNEYLEKILKKKVDLVSIKALKPQLKDEILNEVIYV